MHASLKTSAIGALLPAGAALLTLILLSWLGIAHGTEEAPATFDWGVVSVETSRGVYHFQVEVAHTPAQRSKGLMHRADLAEDTGMLFLFPRDTRVMMWMKDTLIPLDMIFINRRGRVVDIAHDTEPLSLEIITPTQPARAVLEVRAGTARRLGLRTNDRVEWRLRPRPPNEQ